MKVFWFDTETTGLDPVKNAIHEISFIIEIDGEVKEEVSLKNSPPINKMVSQEALAVSGVTLDQIIAYPAQAETYASIKKTLDKYVDRYNKKDKFIQAGFNVKFDIGFLRQMFEDQGNKYFGAYFSSMVIDPFCIQGFIDWQFADSWKHDVMFDRPGNRLMELCKAYEIDVDMSKAHGSLYDIQKTRELAICMKETWLRDHL